MIWRLCALLAAVIICCQPLPQPEPPYPPAPPEPTDGGKQTETGPVDRCELFARAHAAELESIAASQHLSETQITRVFEGACEPFLDDGPDAAITSGLAAARTAAAAVVIDAGAN